MQIINRKSKKQNLLYIVEIRAVFGAVLHCNKMVPLKNGFGWWRLSLFSVGVRDEPKNDCVTVVLRIQASAYER